VTAWLSDHGVTLMAVVNVNPDSFSDPRAATDPEERLSAARAAVAAGASLVDLGAQSAALDAALVPPAEQAGALVPLVEALAADDVAVSVDTWEADVARRVLAAGATVLNDFSGGADPEVVTATAEAGAWYVLTHNPVGPRVRQTDPDFYDDVVDDVLAFFEREVGRLERLGLPADRMVLDPGVDVGKTPRQTLALLRGRDRVRAAVDQPLLWAISRKDVLGALTGRPPADRDAATLALLAGLAHHGRTIARVHAVEPAHDLLRVVGALGGHVDLTDALLDDRLRRQST
jgi:dihydropteroate synthase